MINPERLKQQVAELGLHGLQAHWHELSEAQLPWLTKVLDWELSERQQRGMTRRLHNARIGRFKPLVTSPPLI